MFFIRVSVCAFKHQEALCLEVLAVIRRCCGSSVGKRSFCQPNVVTIVLHLLVSAPFIVKIAAIRLCREVLLDLHPSQVDRLFITVNLLLLSKHCLPLALARNIYIYTDSFRFCQAYPPTSLVTRGLM